jgi:hypothetical protein
VYLNLDPNYFTHPKTRRLIGLLGRGAEVLPIRLWCHVAMHHAESGRLTGYSAQEIEAIVEWWGKEGIAVASMVKVGFVDEHEDGYACHDWDDHEGHIITFREKAREAARVRWDRERSSRCPKHAPSIAPSMPQAMPQPTQSLPDQSNPFPPRKTPRARVVELGVPVNAFEEIWKLYPNRDGKKLAERHFRATVTTARDWIDIQAALKNYLQSERVRKGFVKNGSTWFNGWRDWIQDPEAGKRGFGDSGRTAAGGISAPPGKYAGVGTTSGA